MAYNGKVAPHAALSADPLTIIQQGPTPTQRSQSLAIDDWTSGPDTLRQSTSSSDSDHPRVVACACSCKC